MLTGDLIRPKLRVQGSTVSVEMVDERSPILQQTARELIALFQQHVGQSQVAWEEALENYEGSRIDYLLIRGLAKVLTDAASFAPLETLVPPAIVRERVFARGGVFVSPDLFRPASRQDVLQEVAAELGISLAQIDAWLFADRHAAYRLSHAGLEWTPEGLLARYNLELARGVLYWATHIRVEVASDYKDLWKFIKLFKLMFWAEPKPEGGYTIELDGPISPFVSSTLRYGRQLAAFLPAIFLCDQWRMQAYVHPPQARGEKIYQLDHTSALQSHFKRSGIFDSRLEADFASEFVQKVGDRRGNWRLTRESEVLLLGDTVMVPDFVLTDVRDETRRILIELVGFWHPQYLRRKIEKVRAANCANLLLLVYKGLNVTEEAFRDVASEVIFFQQKPVLKEVMASVESIAERVYGPPPQVIKQKSGRKKRKASLEGESDASSALE
ncbi:MAG TPA: DUF790 family protein [Ktedonobacteraceae bacterium]|jgi:predicted nuclease of restriction endonuclease-like RecB superfamily|nr:DUF790 family protein [Ktedonobacteraceae bacterium]